MCTNCIKFENDKIYDINGKEYNGDLVPGQLFIKKQGPLVLKAIFNPEDGTENGITILDVVQTLVYVERCRNMQWETVAYGDPWEMIEDGTLGLGDIVRFVDENGNIVTDLASDLSDDTGLYYVGVPMGVYQENSEEEHIFDESLLDDFSKEKGIKIEVDDEVESASAEELQFISVEGTMKYLTEYSSILKDARALYLAEKD